MFCSVVKLTRFLILSLVLSCSLGKFYCYFIVFTLFFFNLFLFIVVCLGLENGIFDEVFLEYDCVNDQTIFTQSLDTTGFTSEIVCNHKTFNRI